MLTKVILEGQMRRVVGRPYVMFHCDSVREMFSLLMVNFPNAKDWIRKNAKNYELYEVECEDEQGRKERIDDDGLTMQRECKTVRILPLFTGAGGRNGILQTILGAVVTVIGIVLCCFGQTYGINLVVAGIGMMMGGIITMLMAPSNDEKDDDKKTSYYFNGAVNTTRQGLPVPLVFGRTRVGSAVISASIDVTTEGGPTGEHHYGGDDGGK